VQARGTNRTSLIYSKTFDDGRIEYIERVIETSGKNKPRLVTKTAWVVAPTGVESSLTRVSTPERSGSLPFVNGRVNPSTVSKVVDENGEPMVVYHGTGRDIESFDAGKSGDLQVNGNRTGAWGSYFSPSSKEASIYAEMSGGYQNVVPVTMNLKNPYVMNRFEWGKHTKKSALMDSKEEGRKYAEQVRSEIEEKNHDGIVIRDRGFNDEWVAFNPTQVKSATGNVGAYGQRPITATEAANMGMTEGDANDAQGEGDIRFARGKNAVMTNSDVVGNQGGRNADGKLLAPNGKVSKLTEGQWHQVRSPEFKAWFGDFEANPEKASKVVDENGEPMVMYHGTNHSDKGDAFTYFQIEENPTHGLFGMGAYFTANFDVADSYTTKEKSNTPTIYPVFLSIKNPLDMDAKANIDEWSENFPEVDFDESFVPKKGEPGTNEAFFRQVEKTFNKNEMPLFEFTGEVFENIGNMGYDGITHIGGGRYGNRAGVKHRVYIAHSEYDIKSATGNVGAYGQRPITSSEAANMGMTEGDANDAQGKGDMTPMQARLHQNHRVGDSVLGLDIRPADIIQLWSIDTKPAQKGELSISFLLNNARTPTPHLRQGYDADVGWIWRSQTAIHGHVKSTQDD